MLLGVFIGLVLGVLIAVGVVWYLRQAPLPFENKVNPPERTAPPAGEPRALPLPGKDPAAEKPRFDFYGILEGKPAPAAGNAPPPSKPDADKPVPEKNTKAPPPAPPTPAPASTSAAQTLYLQVGAFQKAEEADNLRAKLTLMGHETLVVEADIPDKGHVWRVRTGPYGSPEAMNAARTQLAQGGIAASLVRGH